MASTYVNDLRLNEMATGDQSGSWGTVTNTNLELIGDAFGYGTEVITTNANDHETLIANGAVDAGRSMFLKYTGALDSPCTITISAGTSSTDFTINKLWFIENATTGSQNIIITSGSGANVTIPAGHTKCIYTDGAGSGGAVVDGFAALSVVDLLVDDDLTVTDDVAIGGLLTVTGGALLNGTTPTLTIGDAGAEDAKIVFDGNAQDYHVGLDDSEDALQIGLGSALGTTPRVTVRVAEVAINDLGIADCDFRVESNDFDHMFFINGGLNNTAIGFNAVPQNQGAGLGILTGSGNGGVHLFREDGSFPSADESLGSFGWSGADSSGSLSTADAKITAFANENMAAGDAGTNIQFYTKADGVNQGTAPTRAMVIASTGQVRFEDGSVSLPSISNSGDTNTGIFFPAADTLGFATSGSEVLRFTTANVQLETGIDFITNTASGATNTRIGTNAGDSIVADNAGVNNVLIGVDAGTALDSGDSNIAIGYRALKTEDDHANNIAIGAFALEQQNAGADAYNVAIGYNAASNATNSSFSTYVGGQAGGLGVITGNTNTVVGYIAGYDLTSGNANVLMGGFAGTNLTTGQDNVAIGTSALDVDLDGNNSVAIGRNALGSQTGTDADMHNTAVGFEAGKGSTIGKFNTFIGSVSGGLGVTTGDHNVGVGVETLYALTSGTSNVAIGYQAGSKLTSGSYNVAIGREALETEDGHGSNVAIGYRSLRLLNKGGDGYNVALGTEAAQIMTTGDACVALGAFALDNNKTGNNIVAVGYGALGTHQVSGAGGNVTAVGTLAASKLTTGTTGTFIGMSSGNHATTCTSTTFVGHNAGFGVSGQGLTGAFNTALGHEAGLKLSTTGHENTFLGSYAGYYNGSSSTANGITTGANNTAIGYAAYPTSATVSNEFTLGNADVSSLRCAVQTISTLSDERDKTNIVDVPLGLDFINTLRPVSFDWNARDGSRVGRKDFGFIAQELKTAQDATSYADHMRLVHEGTILVPDAENSNATEDEEGNPTLDVSGTIQESLEADTMKTYPVLVKAVQELSTALDAALARIAVLEG